MFRASSWRLSVLGYPVLFASSVVLNIASRSAGQYERSDLALVLGAVALATALLTGGALLAVSVFERSDRTAPLAAALAMVVVAWLFFYTASQKLVAWVHADLARDGVLLPVGLVATVLALAWLCRQPGPRLAALSAFMIRFGVLLVVFVAVTELFSETHASQIAKRSRLVRELATPIRATGAVTKERNTPLRDIYVIVLDGHANARVLRDVVDFDNSPFENRLRALGFLVPRDVRSNYVQTYLSLASLLNASHVTQLTEDAGGRSKDHSLPSYLVKNNRVARFLREQGYRFVLFPSAWWAATANSPLADRRFDARRGFDLVTEAYRTELRLAVLRSSLLRFAVPRDDGSDRMALHFMRSFEGLRTMAAGPAPTFAFAHILLPHVPYVVDAQCRPLEQPIADWMEADTPQQRRAYVDQVRCVDALVLDLVTALLQHSSPAPIIVVVGDHGPRFSDIGFYGHPERVPPAFVRERFGAFGAFYLPAGGESVFREPVTLVNVLGHILRYYFGADLPASSDEMYVSGEYLYEFYPARADW